MLLIAAWKEPQLRSGELPIAAQNPQQLRREHDVTVLAAFALLNSDDLPVTVNVADLEKNDFRYAQAGGIDRRQRGTTLETWDRLQEADDLVSAQNNRQLLRFACIGDTLGNGVVGECHAIEKAQRADDLVQRRPRYPGRHQMNLERADILQAQMVGGSAKIPTELRYGGKVGSLGRRRQIADRHVLDHAAAKRAGLSHWRNSCLKGWGSENPQSSQTGGERCDRLSNAAKAQMPPKRLRSIPNESRLQRLGITRQVLASRLMMIDRFGSSTEVSEACLSTGVCFIGSWWSRLR